MDEEGEMLTAEIRINGNLLTYIKAVNKGEGISGSGICIYDVYLYDTESGKTEDIICSHDRAKGALDLVRNIINIIHEINR